MTKHDPRLDTLDASATPADAIAATDAAEETRIAAWLLGGTGVALLLWGGAIALFGWPALIVPALVAVPLIFIGLLLVTWG